MCASFLLLSQLLPELPWLFIVVHCIVIWSNSRHCWNLYFTETLILSDEHKSMLNFSQNKIVTIRWLFRSSFRWYFLLRVDRLSDLSLSLDKHLFNTRMGSCLPYWTCRRVMMMFVDSGDIGVGFWSRFWDRSVVDI